MVDTSFPKWNNFYLITWIVMCNLLETSVVEGGYSSKQLVSLPVLASTVAPVMTDLVRMLQGGQNKIWGFVTQRVVCMLSLPLVRETIQKKWELSRHNKTLHFYRCSVLVPFIFAGTRPNNTSIKTSICWSIRTSDWQSGNDTGFPLLCYST